MPDDRIRGLGPFTIGEPLGGADKVVTVLDIGGQAFCTVHAAHCVGGDLPAAKARANRIAEAMDRADKLPLLSFEDARIAGIKMHDRWLDVGEQIPPLGRQDTAWADMFRAGYEALRDAR